MRIFISILFFLICLPLHAEIVETTDGRKIQLNDDGTYNILENDNSNVINAVTLDCKVDNKEEIRVFKFEVGQTQQDVGKVVLEIINEESTKNIQIKLEENNLAQVDGSDGSLFFNGAYTNSKCTSNFENEKEIKTSTITCKANDSERVYIIKNINGIQQALGEDYDVKFNESEIQLSGRFEILITYSMDYIINGKKYGTCAHEGLKEVVESLGIKFE
tara:strand:- start:332 stop:985 length:654 start_codon:yes stop_codon:yes gene_type:complete